MSNKRCSVEQIVAVLKQLQEWNARLNELVAELSLDKAILRELLIREPVAKYTVARPARRRPRSVGSAPTAIRRARRK
ncbi:MAG: hypothetical protein O9284_17435 [Steroidobacteraceae bacterium]|nr:hypothetical protein [Steroidobacteraceae bacterium]